MTANAISEHTASAFDDATPAMRPIMVTVLSMKVIIAGFLLAGLTLTSPISAQNGSASSGAYLMASD